MRASGRSTRPACARSQKKKNPKRKPLNPSALLDRPALEYQLLENRRGGVRYSVADSEPASVDAVGRLSFWNAFSRSCLVDSPVHVMTHLALHLQFTF
jgi:hypothetical protein